MSWVASDHDAEWPFELLGTSFELDSKLSALLVVDLQQESLYKNSDTEFGIKYPSIVEYWNDRMTQFVMPNTKRLIKYFRENGMRVVYTRNGNVTPHGDELTERLKVKIKGSNIFTKVSHEANYRGTSAYDVSRDIYPTVDDLVVDKLTSSAFHNTMLDHALRNMGIRDIVTVGILTDACVLGTARVAAELGYNSLICEDACGTNTQRAHDEALLVHARILGRVSTTNDVISELNRSK